MNSLAGDFKRPARWIQLDFNWSLGADCATSKIKHPILKPDSQGKAFLHLRFRLHSTGKAALSN